MIGGGDVLGPAERGLIGDTLSGALVAADGTIDWWCPERFDGAPLLTRLLDPWGACVRVGPPVPASGEQTYVEGTMVLTTTLVGAESQVEVCDFLPWDGRPSAGRIVRILRVRRGPAPVVVEVVASGDTRDVHAWSEGVAFDGCEVRCGLPFELSAEPPPAPARPLRRLVARAETVLDTDEVLVVTIDPAGSSEGPLSPSAADRLLERTVTAWRRVADGADVDGPWAPAAIRSLLVVTALSGIAGAPVAAPVTSLPRVVGGERQRDGRVVEPRTAAAWARVARAAGLAEQSADSAAWLAAALDHEPPLPSALAPDGGAPPTEANWTGVTGWRGSQPVLLGTNAPDRLSLEPGAAAVALVGSPAGEELRSHWDQLVAHADWIADHWADRDATVWDLGGPRRPWVAPRLAARAALVSAAASARSRNPLDLDAAGWHTAARDIERSVLEAVGSGAVLDVVTDAGLARMAWLGPWPAWDQVAVATLERLIERNGQGPWIYPWPEGLDDGLPGVEPPSVEATLWVARALALAGREDEANERIEAAAGLAGPLGLLPESVDPVTGMALGNRPAAAAHVALLGAILAVAEDPG
jgi:hypothetical protein